jgi:TetR/AcrR family transcriptional regulator, regulator of cefoperazone and chloramphenicol sensitivity
MTLRTRPPPARHSGSRPKRPRSDQRTRQLLLEAAGKLFAEKGFDRATGKEICRRAGANAAAVNYHFGGIGGLYTAVIWEAHGRFVTFDAMAAAVADKADARAKLRAIFELLVRTLTGPTSTSWVLRVLAREIVAPTQAIQPLLKKEFLPKMRILKGIVGELLGLAEDDPAVARGCLSVMGPCFMLLIGDRRTFRRAFPSVFRFAPASVDALVEHLVEFSLAGLSGIAKAAQLGP